MNNLMRTEPPDNWGLKELQNVILNIAYDIDQFCQKHNITYRLMGGSALGAKRHGGFIPWDDDLDVFMTPDEYEQFRDAFDKYGNKDKYYLQELGAARGKVITAKVRLNNSCFEEEIIKNWHVHQGIYVDIFILHTCPNNKILRYWQYIWAKYVIIKGLANKEYKRRGGAVYYMLKCMKLLPKRFLLNFGLNQVYAFRNQKTDFYCNYLGKALLKNGTYKHKHFATVKRVPFETIELNVAGGLEDFLTDRFGDYMEVPSMDRIRYEQHASKWALGNYKYEDLSDEKYMF
ncbi:LicD family protein [Bacteroides pyogenes]|uniref:LicD family protein n=1 Tax=Bacteroides pyogenes TaxID=310300 RepID=UPI003F9F2CAD